MDPYPAAGRPGRAARLTNRDGERKVLDRLADAVRAGESRVLVVRGDPGVGKSVLLDYLAGRARGCRVARATGVQSEMELAFAGLHWDTARGVRCTRGPVEYTAEAARAGGPSSSSATASGPDSCTSPGTAVNPQVRGWPRAARQYPAAP